MLFFGRTKNKVRLLHSNCFVYFFEKLWCAMSVQFGTIQRHKEINGSKKWEPNETYMWSIINSWYKTTKMFAEHWSVQKKYNRWKYGLRNEIICYCIRLAVRADVHRKWHTFWGEKLTKQRKRKRESDKGRFYCVQQTIFTHGFAPTVETFNGTFFSPQLFDLVFHYFVHYGFCSIRCVLCSPLCVFHLLWLTIILATVELVTATKSLFSWFSFGLHNSYFAPNTDR